jgi:hypothetical protein
MLGTLCVVFEARLVDDEELLIDDEHSVEVASLGELDVFCGRPGGSVIIVSGNYMYDHC